MRCQVSTGDSRVTNRPARWISVALEIEVVEKAVLRQDGEVDGRELDTCTPEERWLGAGRAERGEASSMVNQPAMVWLSGACRALGWRLLRLSCSSINAGAGSLGFASELFTQSNHWSGVLCLGAGILRAVGRP